MARFFQIAGMVLVFSVAAQGFNLFALVAFARPAVSLPAWAALAALMAVALYSIRWWEAHHD